MPSFTLLHKYMHRDVYDTHHLNIIDNAQVMTKSIIDDALFQAMPHIKHTMTQFFGVMEFCPVHLLPHF